jgi:hypothetical protein
MERPARRWLLASGVLLLLLLLLEGLPSGPASATGISYFANKTADDSGGDPGDCTTPTNTDCSLRAAVALANANAGSTVVVAAGTFTLDHADPADLSNPSGLILSADMTIAGQGEDASIIQANAAPNTATYRVISNAASTVTISGVTVRNGAVTGTTASGAGIQAFGNTTIQDSRISGNTLTVTDGGSDGEADGAGVFGAGAGLTIIHSNVSGNTINATATTGFVNAFGAGVYNFFGSLTITDSTFANNSVNLVASSSNSLAQGGAIYNGTGTFSVTNSTFAENSVDGGSGGRAFGGGVKASGSSNPVTVTDSTFSGNSVSGTNSSGGGIHITGVTTTLSNVIVANSTGDDLVVASGNMTGNNNLIDDSSISQLSSGTDNIQQPALLAPLGNYGGTTETVALLPGSPAIEAGAPLTGLTADQRGVTRDTTSPDIGALESQGFKLTPVDGSTPQSAGTGSAFANALAVTVAAIDPVEPVDGGLIDYSVTPNAGASATLSAASATVASGEASVTATANSTVGSYTATASAAGATSATFALTNTAPVDSSPPTTTATASNADDSDYTFGTWTKQSVEVTLTPSDVTATVGDYESGVATTAYVVDAGSQTSYSDPFTISTEGDHFVSFQSEDNANNLETIQTVHVMIDLTAPVTTATATNADSSSYTFGTWTNQSVEVTLDPSDGGGSGLNTTSYTVDGGDATSYTGPFSLSTEGDHVVTFMSTDNATNSETTQTVHVMIDLTDPTTTASATNGDSSPYTFGLWTNQSVEVTLTPSDTGGSGVATTSYTVDSGSPTTYSTPFTISTEGDHIITYLSVDHTTNTETTHSVHVMIDQTDPATTASAINDDSSSYAFDTWTRQAVAVTLDPSDAGGSSVDNTYYTLDAGDQTPYTGPFTLSIDGDHIVTFWSVDHATNTETVQTVHVQIDKTAPTTNASATNADTSAYSFGNWTNQAVEVTLTPSDASGSGVATTSYTVDSGSSTPYTEPFSISTEGDHVVTYSSTDNATNSETTQTVHVMIDLTDPTTTAGAANADSSSYTFGTLTNQAVEVTLDPSDGGGSGLNATSYTIDGVGPTPYSGPFTINTDGDHVITFWSVDHASNVETVQTVHVQIELPVTVITPDSLCALTEQDVQNNLVSTWLCAPLRLVTFAEAIHSPWLKQAAINAYIFFINSQRNGNLSPEEIATLTQMARSL